MLDKLKNLEGYYKDFLTVVSGSALSFLIPLLMSPILSRIYKSSDYGVMAVFMTLVVLFTSAVGSHYLHGIMLQKKKADAWNLIFLCFFINLGISLILLGLISVMSTRFVNFFAKSDTYTSYIYLVPLVVLMNGTSSTMQTWLNANKEYKIISTTRIVNAVSAVVFQISYAIILPLIIQGFKPDFSGLIVGYLLSTFLTFLLIVYYYIKKNYFEYFRFFSFKRMKELALREKKYMIYAFPNDFLLSFAANLPIMLISKYMTLTEIGNYSFSQKFLGMPISILSNSFLDVFKQEAIEEIHETGSCSKVFFKTLRALSLFGLIPLVTLLLFAPKIFPFVFGSQWVLAGEYAQILSIMYFFNLVSGPLSYVYIIRGKLFEDLVIHGYIILSSAASLYVGYEIFNSSKIMVLLFTINYCFVYLYYLIRSYFLSLTPEEEEDFFTENSVNLEDNHGVPAM
ncbi:MAG: oligosaccharide flippase family protein [Chitinophagales bacterium]|nr:oligosaccharide flippase family protein [Chitinophagales bacterium]